MNKETLTFILSQYLKDNDTLNERVNNALLSCFDTEVPNIKGNNIRLDGPQSVVVDGERWITRCAISQRSLVVFAGSTTSSVEQRMPIGELDIRVRLKLLEYLVSKGAPFVLSEGTNLVV